MKNLKKVCVVVVMTLALMIGTTSMVADAAVIGCSHYWTAEEYEGVRETGSYSYHTTNDGIKCKITGMEKVYRKVVYYPCQRCL